MSLTPLTDIDRAVARDRLFWLSIGYYVMGGLGILFSSLLIFHTVLFSGIGTLAALGTLPADELSSPASSSPSDKKYRHDDDGTLLPPSENIFQKSRDAAGSKVFGLLFVLMGAFCGVLMVLGWIFGGLTLYAGRCLAQRKHRTFICVIAAIHCLFIPVGTVFAVLTFLAMNTPGAKAEFGLPPLG